MGAGFRTWTAGEVVTASNVQNYLQDQVVIVCTSGTRPGTPEEGMTIWETDTDDLLIYNGSAWRAPWNLPWGILDYAQVTAAQNNVEGGVDLTGLSLTVTVPANRRIRTTVVSAFLSTVGGDLGRLDITDTTPTVKNAAQVYLSSAGNTFAEISYVETTVAGAITRKARYTRTSGTGVHTMNASATQPSYILIEDVGPNGAAA